MHFSGFCCAGRPLHSASSKFYHPIYTITPTVVKHVVSCRRSSKHMVASVAFDPASCLTLASCSGLKRVPLQHLGHPGSRANPNFVSIKALLYFHKVFISSNLDSSIGRPQCLQCDCRFLPVSPTPQPQALSTIRQSNLKYLHMNVTSISSQSLALIGRSHASSDHLFTWSEIT